MEARRAAIDWLPGRPVLVLLVLAIAAHAARAVSGIYVNNQKMDKFEANRIKLLHPATPSANQPAYMGKDDLLTRDNFTSPQHYYQYLVGANPASYIDLLWGRNKTHFPSLFRIGAGAGGAFWTPASTSSPPVLLYNDELSSIKNTLNDTSPAYVGDYHRVQPSSDVTQSTARPTLRPVTSTRAPAKPSRRLRKKPTAPTPAPSYTPASATGPGAASAPVAKTDLTPEMLSLLSRYYSFSCTLIPKQQVAGATQRPPLSSTKVRRLTTRRPTTTARPLTTTSASVGKRKKTTVFVEPPVIKRIGGMLESVYDFMENALTSSEYVADSAESRGGAAALVPAHGERVEVKRNTRHTLTLPAELGAHGASGPERTTIQPWPTSTVSVPGDSSKRFTPDRVTISGLPPALSEGNKNKLTTNIQVTSEYTAATPPTLPVRQPQPSEADDESSEEYSAEDYFGGFAGFDDGAEDDDDDDDNDDDDNDDDDDDDDEGDDGEDDDDQSQGGDSEELAGPNEQAGLVNDKDYGEDGSQQQAGKPLRVKRGKRRRRKKRPASYEDTAEYSEEDTSDEGGEYDDRNDAATDEEEEDDEEEEGEEEEEDYDSGEASDGAEGFFSGMFSSLGRFVRSLGFGGAARGTPEADDYVDYDEGGDRGGRSTTPRVLDTRRRPTRSTSNGAGPATQIERDTDVSAPNRSPPSTWLGGLPPAYLFNEINEDAATGLQLEELPVLDMPVPPTLETPLPVVSPTESGWFELMMPWDFFNPWAHGAGWDAGGESVSSSPVEVAAALQVPEPAAAPAPLSDTPTAAPAPAGWLSQFFGTTKAPPSRKPPTHMPPPEQLLSALAQYIVQASPTKRPAAAAHPSRNPTPSRTSYAGYQLWRVSPQTEEHVRQLVDYRRSVEGIRLQWWSGPSLREPTDVLVPPAQPAITFHEYLVEEGMQYEPTIRDLGRAIAYENPRMTRREQIETELLHGHPLTWYRYHRYADIVKFQNYLQRRHPQQVQLLHIGRSYEGRPLTVVRVSFAPRSARRVRRKPARRRPAVFVEAGAHGQQWIGPAVATWLLQRLVETNGTEAELEAVRSHDWYVLPLLNPDGYEYSHEHDRMWSKSRSKPDQQDHAAAGVGQALLSSALNWWNTQPTRGVQADEPCHGVDLTHNWAYRWEDASGGSRSECSANFAGPAPFSEPETRAIRDFLLAAGRRNVRLYVSLQAYGQQLSYPSEPGESGETRHPYGDAYEMAAVGLEAMRGSGGELQYSVDRSHGAAGGGTAAGYARHGAGIRYSYTLRLPDTGTHGFLLPPSNIVPTGRDTFEMLKGMLDYS